MLKPTIYCVSLNGEEEYLARFAHSLKLLDFEVVKCTIAEWYVKYEDIAKSNPAIVFGTTNIVYDLFKTHPAKVPWFYPDLYKPYTYAAAFAPILSSQLVEAVTFGQLKKLKYSEPFFIKPNSGKKAFTGFVVESQKDIDELASLDISESFELVIFEAVKMGREIRTVVYNNVIYAASYYKNERGDLDVAPVSPETLMTLTHFYYGELYKNNITVGSGKLLVVDFNELIVDRKPYYSVIEVNSIHSSGFYDCDTDEIAKVIRFLC